MKNTKGTERERSLSFVGPILRPFEYHTYGYLSAAGDYQTYRFYHASSCGVGFNIRLDSTNSKDVDLFVTGGNFTSTGPFNESRTSTSSTEIVSWQVAAPGWYTAVVKHKSTDSAYVVTHQTTYDCPSGRPSGGSPSTESYIQDGSEIHYIAIQ